MTGEPNQNIEYLEAIGWLKYKGNEEFFVLNEEKAIIASVVNDSLCVIKNGQKNCHPINDGYISIKALNAYFKENKKFKTYLKIGSGKPIKYIFKKTRLKNNNEYQSQIVRASLQDCYDAGGG